MSELYDRKAELIIADKKWSYPELNIEFGVGFDYDDDPNVSEVRIFNLNNDSINSIKKGLPCTLNAGYGEDTATILAGVVYEAFTTKDGTDVVTSLKVVDVQNQYLNTKVSKTYKGPANAEFILKDIFNQIGMKINIIKLNNNFIYQKGFTANGKVLDVAKRIVKDCKSRLVVKNNVVNIVAGAAGIESGYLLTPQNGLISIAPTSNSKTNANFKVQSLLLNKLASRSFLEIQSKYFSGIVMVTEGKHDNFVSTFEVMTIG